LYLALLVFMSFMLRRSAGKLAMMDLVFAILIAGAAPADSVLRPRASGKGVTRAAGIRRASSQ
jgi:uncharacterized membrane protein YcaP (DUF421 family)